MISHEEMRKARSSNSELIQLEGEWYTQLQMMKEHLSLQQERKKEVNKKYYQDHQEDARTRNKEYYQSHKEERKKYGREYSRRYYQPIHSDKHDKPRPEKSRGFLSQKESRNLLPSVIVPELTPKKDAFTRTQWHELKKIYNYTCLCCGKKEPEIELVADHVIPQSRGGLTVIDNMQPLCRSCNAKKHAKTIDYRKIVERV